MIEARDRQIQCSQRISWVRASVPCSLCVSALMMVLNPFASASAAVPSGTNLYAQIETDSSASQESLEDAIRRLQNEAEPLDRSPAGEQVPATQINPDFAQYRLGPGDSFFVNVRRFPEVNFQGTLDLEGNVVVPLAGVINFQGLTLEQAESQIQAALERFFIDPDVGLTLVTQRPVAVTVLGEVVRPGLYPLANPEISTALLSAGGTTRLANLRTIQIRRPIRDQSGATVDSVTQTIDLFTPLAEATELPDIQLADGDVVVIPTLTAQELQTYDRTLVARSTLSQPDMNIRLLDYTRGLSNVVLPNGSDFLDALTATGTDLINADLSDIAIIRFDPQDGAYVAQEVNAKDALRGDISQNPTLEDEDIVIIGRNLIARISYFFTRIAQPVRDPLQFLLLFDTIVEFAGGEDN